MEVDVFPAPKEARFGKETVDLTDARYVRVDPEASGRLKRRALAFTEAVGGAFARPPEVTAGEPNAGQTLVNVRLLRRGVPPQGYRLAADADGVELRARDEAGACYGLETLRQIVEQCGARPPAFEMADEPDFPARGLMLDISRCKVPKMATLFATVDLMARLKLNQLQLYTEHTFAFSEHEAVWHDASPMTPAEVLALDDYCRERCVELVPNLNSFGHFERWLRHPEYRRLAECPDGFEYPWGGRSPWGSVLRPNRNSLRLLGSLYREFLPNFTSGLFNVGCDETWGLGQGWSRELCEEKGATRVYLDFLLRIHELVRKHGRRMMFWGDIILHQPELIEELPEDVVALEWGYGAKHPFDRNCRAFKRAGATFYVCPGTSSWNSLTGRTANALANLANAARNGARNGAAGCLITDWGDGGHHQYWPLSYPGLFAGAAYSWCLKGNKDADIGAAVNRLALRDETGALGELLLELGRVCETVPKQASNGTVFNELLFNELGAEWVLKGLTAGSLRRCIRRFDELADGIGRTRPRVADGALVKAELRNAVAMARLGCERGLAGLDPGSADAGKLRRALQHVIGEHERLWLARNRPGGLHESSARLRKQLGEPQ
jgi:hypothetical protein